MLKVTEALQAAPGPVFVCDFSPPRGSAPDLLADAQLLDADFICVAYNPGKAVRVDSSAAAYHIWRETGRNTIFNLAPRDMNLLALQSRLLGADLLGLRNVLVVQGDAFSERDGLQPASNLRATQLIESIAQLNAGLDFKGLKLRGPCDFCIGASLDLGKGTRAEARLALRKARAGAHFFLSQPVFDVALITEFLAAYEDAAGEPLDRPVLWGLQILARDGILFSSVPDDLRRDLEAGRDGVDIALETYALFAEADIRGVYLVAPIMRGGARDYEAAARFLAEVKGPSASG